MVEAEPIGAFNRHPMDLVLNVGDRLVVNRLLKHVFLSVVQLESLLDDLEGVPLSKKAPIFNENPPIVGRPQDLGTRRTFHGNGCFFFQPRHLSPPYRVEISPAGVNIFLPYPCPKGGGILRTPSSGALY